MAIFNEVWYDSTQGNHLKTLVNHIKNLNEGRIIEIGCWEGNSSQYVITEANPQEVLCVDNWKGCITESIITGVEHITVSLSSTRDIKQQFIDNMNELTEGNYLIVEEECVNWLSNTTETIKFCHYDASHDYEACFDVLTKLKAITVEEGCLCGDDILSANEDRTDLHGGMERAVKELLPGYKTIGNLWYWFNSTKNYVITDNGVEEIVVPDPTEVVSDPTEVVSDPTEVVSDPIV